MASSASVLYYSNNPKCIHSSALLNTLKNHPPKNMNYLCVDRRFVGNDGKTYLPLQDGQHIIMPPNITRVPALVLLTNYNILYGEDIYAYIGVEQERAKFTATQGNMEPMPIQYQQHQQKNQLPPDYSQHSAQTQHQPYQQPAQQNYASYQQVQSQAQQPEPFDINGGFSGPSEKFASITNPSASFSGSGLQSLDASSYLITNGETFNPGATLKGSRGEDSMANYEKLQKERGYSQSHNQPHQPQFSQSRTSQSTTYSPHI